MRSLRIVGIVALACCAAAAHGADVSGTVRLPGRGVAREAVVYLVGRAKAQPLAHAVVDQRNKTFLPHVSVVTVGTTVQFPNNDTVFHNVFAYFHAKKFDLGMYPRGATRKVTFDREGLVALLCNVHSEMSAYIMVVDTPYYAVTDGHGRYHIAGVPAGAYTLHAWHESGATTVAAVTVGGGATTLDAQLGRK